MKYTETMIIESKDIRNELINRVDVLNKVKKVLTLPKMEVMTMNQVADFYGVPSETIDRCYGRNKEEIDMDGVVSMTPKTYKELTNGTRCSFSKSASEQGKTESGFVDYTQYRTHIIVHIDENTDVMIPNRGIKVFPIRAVLRVGMLLTQSAIAKEVRTQLLNVLGVAKETNPAIVTQELEKEEALYVSIVKNIVSGDKQGTLMAFQDIVDYHKRHVLELEKKIDEVETANQLLTAKLMTISNRSALSRVIRCLSPKVGKSYGQIWNEFYAFLFYRAHIDLKKRAEKPFVKNIRDDEWATVQQVLLGYIEKNGINAPDFIMSCEIVK